MDLYKPRVPVSKLSRDEALLLSGVALDAAESCMRLHTALWAVVEAYGSAASTLADLLEDPS